MPKRRYLAAFAVLALASTLAPSSSVAAGPSTAGDIDGDGRADLVVGIPSEDIGDTLDAGAITVLFGTDSGIGVDQDQTADQGTLGGNVEELDRFGNALAYGDFDGDGFDDVAIGAPGEDLDGEANSGVVHIIFGSSNGLDFARRDVISQLGEVAGENETGDFFGADVAAGDFNGDGVSDLVVGSPGEDVGNIVAAGAVTVLYGQQGQGLSTANTLLLTQAGAPVPGDAEEFDGFGSAVTAGDLNGDGNDDLIIGVPGEDVGDLTDAGIIHVIYGAGVGLSPGGELFSQNAEVPGITEAGDRFGFDVTTGDVNADGFQDIIIGAPGEAVGDIAEAGGITVLYGAAVGVTRPNSVGYTAAGPVAGVPEAGDQFGYRVVAGDFNGDGDDDVAVGAPFEDLGTLADAGAITILGGSPQGLMSSGSFFMSQLGPVAGAAEAGDGFGFSLRVGDFNGDETDDLAVGTPFEDIGTIADAGGVVILYGSGNSLSENTSVFLSQATPGLFGNPETNDRFGSGL